MLYDGLMATAELSLLPTSIRHRYAPGFFIIYIFYRSVSRKTGTLNRIVHARSRVTSLMPAQCE